MRASPHAPHTAPLGAWRRRFIWRPAAFFSSALLASVILMTLAACSPRSLLPIGQATLSGNAVSVPAQVRHGVSGSTLIIVDIAINGKGPYPFALDTGASLTLIDRTLANRLGLAVAGAPEEITGIGGTQRVTPIKVSQWAMGSARLPAMTITSASLTDLQRSAGVDGLLGSDVLSKFGSVTIDYANSVVIVTPPN